MKWLNVFLIKKNRKEPKMPSYRYAISVSLKQEDYKKLKELQKKGIKVVDIFRRGLIEVSKENIEPLPTE